MTNQEYQELQDKLEELVDKSDISIVIQALSSVCFAKSTHIQENWQDRVTAKYWMKVGSDLNNIDA